MSLVELGEITTGQNCWVLFSSGSFNSASTPRTSVGKLTLTLFVLPLVLQCLGSTDEFLFSSIRVGEGWTDFIWSVWSSTSSIFILYFSSCSSGVVGQVLGKTTNSSIVVTPGSTSTGLSCVESVWTCLPERLEDLPLFFFGDAVASRVTN